MNNSNEKLNLLVKKEKLRNALKVLLIAVILLSGIAFLAMPPIGKTSEVKGTALSSSTSASTTRSYVILTVKLAGTGKVVNTEIPSSSYFKKGKQVNLLKQEALIFGSPIYIFQGYYEK